MLFRWGKFKSAAGYELDWKIECDALDNDDWACIARMCAALVPPFYMVTGVPRGGLRFAEHMTAHQSKDASTILVVDDVWTTGLSMHRHVGELGLQTGEWHGLVAFSRTYRLPAWVHCLCQINSP